MAETWDAQGLIRISGWKQIAAYLGEEVDVVQAWAQHRGLPLHRWADGRRGMVFAYAADLDAWMRQQLVTGVLQPPEPVAPSSAAEAPETRTHLTSVSRRTPAADQPHAAPPRTLLADQRQGGSRAFLAAAVSLFVLVLFAALVHAVQVSLPQSQPASTRQPVLPASPAAPVAPASVQPRSTATLLLPSGSPHQPDRESAELYLEGRYSWNRRTSTSLTQARLRFADAIRHDPQYAQAYAGLAESYFLLRQYGHMPERIAFSRAEAAARKAVALDPQSCEAHRSLAFVLSYWTWDMPAAEREFRRAIALDPADAEAHNWYATSLMSRGRYPEALAQIDQARRLQPASSAIRANYGLILLLSGNTGQGIDVLRQVEASDPGFVMTHIYLANEDLRTRQDLDFLKEEQIVADLQADPDLARETRSARRSLRRGGHDAMLRTIAGDAAARADRGGNAYHAAFYQMLAGHRQAALHYLELSHNRHEPSFLSVDNQVDFPALASNPQFHILRALADPHS